LHVKPFKYFVVHPTDLRVSERRVQAGWFGRGLDVAYLKVLLCSSLNLPAFVAYDLTCRKNEVE
jgi:hypothetical protein